MKNKEKIIGSVCILIITLVFTIGGYLINKDEKSYKNNDEIFVETRGNVEENIFDNGEEKDKNFKNNEGTDSSKIEEIIVVDIKGAVKAPKEYKVIKGSRIRDLIDKAGGLTEEANNDMIHFSKILEDEDCIVIPKLGEENIQAVMNEAEGPTNNLGNNNNKTSKNSGKININKASIDELQSLPGIGETRAKAIVDYRDSNGGFKSVEELSNIDGIGSKTMDKLADKVDIR